MAFVFGSEPEPYLWRSTDNGQSWTDKRVMAVAAYDEQLGSVCSTFNRTLYISQSITQLYFLGTSGEIWHSTDAGASFTLHQPQLQLETLLGHPTVPNYALGGNSVACPDAFTGRTCHELHLSKDAGETWSLVNPLVLDFSWGKLNIHWPT